MPVAGSAVKGEINYTVVKLLGNIVIALHIVVAVEVIVISFIQKVVQAGLFYLYRIADHLVLDDTGGDSTRQVHFGIRDVVIINDPNGMRKGWLQVGVTEYRVLRVGVIGYRLQLAESRLGRRTGIINRDTLLL